MSVCGVISMTYGGEVWVWVRYVSEGELRISLARTACAGPHWAVRRSDTQFHSTKMLEMRLKMDVSCQKIENSQKHTDSRAFVFFSWPKNGGVTTLINIDKKFRNRVWDPSVFCLILGVLDLFPGRCHPHPWASYPHPTIHRCRCPPHGGPTT